MTAVCFAALLPLAAGADPRLETLTPSTARPGERVAVAGNGFGTEPGVVLVSGVRTTVDRWSDRQILFHVAEHHVSGPVRVRTADALVSGSRSLTVDHVLPPGQFAPAGLALEDTGLPGAAFLVQTDGAFLYGISGFETLTTHALRPRGPHALRSRFYLNQRVTALRLHGGYLFCAGDHGLIVLRCEDLQENRLAPVAAVTGGSYMAVDVRPDPRGQYEGVLVALAEHAPRIGSDQLRVVFHAFSGEELEPLGAYSRAVGPDERYHAVALDPLTRRAYVSGWERLLGANRYLLELDISDLAQPILNHREDTGNTLISHMDAFRDVLWTGVVDKGAELFRAHTLKPGGDPLQPTRSIRSGWGLARVARVKVLDDNVTVGCAWFGSRPDLFLFSTFGTGTAPAATHSSVDWAFDVTGHAGRTANGDGRIIVADEWGGFLTLDYRLWPKLALLHQPDYQQIVTSAMTEGLHLTSDRIYIANRGAGVWSADRFDLNRAEQWRSVDWDWSQRKPQPHPVSAVCTRDDPRGRLIAALGHEKAMAWGSRVLGLLYRETDTTIQLLATSEEITPPGLNSTPRVSAVWPEPDLVFMATGGDGFRAYVVDPLKPSIRLHRDCRDQGFGGDTYGAANMATCLEHHTVGTDRFLVVGSAPGLLSGQHTLNVFRIEYPQGAPNRRRPDAPIVVTKEASLTCSSRKTIFNLEVRPSGLLALATSQGLAMFHLDWLPALNRMPNVWAWNRICVSDASYAPWHDPTWQAAVKAASFADENELYVVKQPHGVWRLTLAVDPAGQTVRAKATAFYPGVECGMNYARMLHGWANPDIVTLHHPYRVLADGAAVYVTGWSGKVQRLVHTGEGHPR
ncbi:MAG: hypothetical protein FJ276_10410 [Planctomycetes bacterium]|nr:hypothetical protein [Planctomycetota bacterium]